MYAFVSHQSACEALRSLNGDEQRWPNCERMLPLMGECVGGQMAFRQLASKIDLAGLGINQDQVDILVPRAGARSRGQSALLHVWSRVLPVNSMYRVHSNLLVSGPELTIIQLCGTHSKLDALLDDFAQAVWAQQDINALTGTDERVVVDDPLKWDRMRRLLAATVVACEFAGTYRLPNAARKTTWFNAPKLMTIQSLQEVAQKVGVWSPEARAVRAAGLAFDGSASPMETALALLLTLPLEYGGFGLPRPRLNVSPDVSSMRPDLSDRDEVRCDMFWERECVALEYDSYEFHGYDDLAQLTNDALRANILASMGYSVFRVTYGSVRSLARVELLAHQLAKALGVSLKQANEIQKVRRTKLYVELMPKRRELA